MLRLGLLALALGAVLLAVRTLTPAKPMDAHVSGDGADALAVALFAGPDAPGRAATAAEAALEVVALRRWQNLEALPDLRRLCGPACDGGAGVVSIMRPMPRGLVRTVILDLSAFGGGAALDAGEALDAAVAACAAALIRAMDVLPPGCRPPTERRVWRLPYGL